MKSRVSIAHQKSCRTLCILYVATSFRRSSCYYNPLSAGGRCPPYTKLVDLFATNRQQVSVDSGGGLYVTQPADILRIRLGLTVMVLVVIASYGRWPPDYSTGPVVFFLEGNFFLPCCMRPYRAIAGPERM